MEKWGPEKGKRESRKGKTETIATSTFISHCWEFIVALLFLSDSAALVPLATTLPGNYKLEKERFTRKSFPTTTTDAAAAAAATAATLSPPPLAAPLRFVLLAYTIVRVLVDIDLAT